MWTMAGDKIREKVSVVGDNQAYETLNPAALLRATEISSALNPEALFPKALVLAGHM